MEEVQKLKRKDDVTATVQKLEEENKKRYEDFLKQVEELKAKDLESRGYLTQKDVEELKGALKTYNNTVKMFDELGWDESKHPNQTLEEQIQSLEKQGDDFKKEGDFPGKTEKEKAIVELVCRREAERLRVRFKRKQIHAEALKTIQEEAENNPGTAFEKYKDFVKKNFIGIARLLITIGGIITSVALAMKSGTKRVANTTQKAGNTVERVLGPIGNTLGQIFRRTGKIMSWFADHLMILIEYIIMLVFGIRKKKKVHRQKAYGTFCSLA